MSVKLCIDCRHHVAEDRADKCGHDTAIDLVTGETSVYCRQARERYAICGPTATLWEAKEPEKTA